MAILPAILVETLASAGQILTHPCAGRVVALATMHGKEAAIAPALGDIGLQLKVPAGLDTDALGTFSGEIPRKGTMGEVAIKKARMGMELLRVPLGVASEGTFGPHPSIPFITAGMELMMFVDDERGFTVSEGLVTEKTNFAHAVARDAEELDAFLSLACFPSHALIVSPAANEGEPLLFKAVSSRDGLAEAIAACAAASADGQALITTDMRAHLNPTRMTSLAALADRLAARLASICPACATPGFGRVDVKRGLPCEVCGAPTEWVVAEILGCALCDYREERVRSDAKATVGPECCPLCNP